MVSLKILSSVLIALWLSQCSTSKPNLQNPDNPAANSPVNSSANSAARYKDVTTGTWEGWYDKPVMRLTFNDDGTMTVHYLSGGAKFKVPYKFKDERTLETNRYPDNLVIVNYTEDEFSFRPEAERLRADLDMIYACRFVRPLK